MPTGGVKGRAAGLVLPLVMWPPLLARFSLLMEIFAFFLPRAAFVRAAAAAREFPSAAGIDDVSVVVWAVVVAAGAAVAG
jgi:hypothetical protein